MEKLLYFFRNTKQRKRRFASSSLHAPILASVDGYGLSVTSLVNAGSGTGSNQTPFVCDGGAVVCDGGAGSALRNFS